MEEGMCQHVGMEAILICGDTDVTLNACTTPKDSGTLAKAFLHLQKAPTVFRVRGLCTSISTVQGGANVFDVAFHTIFLYKVNLTYQTGADCLVSY